MQPLQHWTFSDTMQNIGKTRRHFLIPALRNGNYKIHVPYTLLKIN
jgi:hypothetical protein